jgi:hypothetical protein
MRLGFCWKRNLIVRLNGDYWFENYLELAYEGMTLFRLFRLLGLCQFHRRSFVWVFSLI